MSTTDAAPTIRLGQTIRNSPLVAILRIFHYTTMLCLTYATYALIRPEEAHTRNALFVVALHYLGHFYINKARNAFVAEKLELAMVKLELYEATAVASAEAAVAEERRKTMCALGQTRVELGRKRVACKVLDEWIEEFGQEQNGAMGKVDGILGDMRE